MPTILDETGFQIETKQESRQFEQQGMIDIYGNIDFSSNTQNGQEIEIKIQAKRDILESLLVIFNSFDPDQASGRILDDRVALNNIVRNGGSWATQAIEITVNKSVTLQGLDANALNPDASSYTVRDNGGNLFYLLDTVTFPAAGTYTVSFRPQYQGNIITIPNTITNAQTVVFGVVSINNPTGVTLQGTDEESDASLRFRRQKSFANGATGSDEAVQSGLINLPEVTDVRVYDVDSNGIPVSVDNPNLWGIYIIVDGAASSEDIAQVLYEKVSAGTRMYGDINIPIERSYGNPFIATFDRTLPKNLYIKFILKPTTSNQTFNLDAIKQYIVDKVNYGIGEYADTAYLTCLIQEAIKATGTLGVVLDVQISKDNTTYQDYLTTDFLNEKWVITTDNIFPTVVPMGDMRKINLI